MLAIRWHPLAIELAAARVKVLSVEQIAARLDDRFSLLTDGSRTDSPRHQTLLQPWTGAMLLLSEAERALLRGYRFCRRMYSGSSGRQYVAEQAGQAALLPTRFLDRLSHLVDKSLVIVERHDQQIAVSLAGETRQYARQLLSRGRGRAGTRASSRAISLGLAEEAEPVIGQSR